MEDKLIEKSKYIETTEELIKPVIEYAIGTKEFREDGCFSKEFVKVGDCEVSLCVLDHRFVVVETRSFYDRLKKASVAYSLEKENEKLKSQIVELESELNSRNLLRLLSSGNDTKMKSFLGTTLIVLFWLIIALICWL